jgi:hypothetical protein
VSLLTWRLSPRCRTRVRGKEKWLKSASVLEERVPASFAPRSSVTSEDKKQTCIFTVEMGSWLEKKDGCDIRGIFSPFAPRPIREKRHNFVDVHGFTTWLCGDTSTERLSCPTRRSIWDRRADSLVRTCPTTNFTRVGLLIDRLAGSDPSLLSFRLSAQCSFFLDTLYCFYVMSVYPNFTTGKLSPQRSLD